jgi:hypothetical protein
MDAQPAVVCDLANDTTDRERAAVFVAEFLIWWHEAGRMFYSPRCRQRDDGLTLFAQDAVRVLGGWRAARRLLRTGA